MTKKEKKQPKDFLREAFGEKKELVVNDTNKEKIERELTKKGIGYALGDYPIVRDGNVVGYEKKIVLNRPLSEEGI